MENKNPFYYSGYCNLHKRSYIGTCPICVTGVQLDPPASPPSPAIEGIKWVCPECGRIYDSKPASCSFCNSGPTFTTEGEEELDRLESFNREEVKNILMEFSYDFQQEKYGGCSTHRHIVSLFIKAHRELFSTPTPPAGEERAADRMTEGEGEIPFDVCTDIYNMWVEDKGGFFFPPYQAGAIAMWRKMQDEAIAKDKIISGLRERLRIIISNSEEFGSDYANCRQELSAAQSRIVELEKQLAEDDIWDAVRKYRDAHPEPQEDESWERRKIDRLCDVIGISEDQIRELEDEVKAQKAKQRELVAELQKQLAEEKSFHANWRAIADQYEADKKELEAKVQLRNDQMVTSSNRIEGLIDWLKQLQEWHDSHC